MAKEIAIGKRAKISEAQQYMLLAVLAASIFLGAGVSLVSHFIKQIAFNAKVIAAEEQSVAAYSDIIKSIGVCKKPNGSIYSGSELEECDPNAIEVSQIPDSLRSNILEKLAANQALNSVPKESESGCINSETSKPFTYKELNQMYKEANGSDGLQAASALIKKCSALRIIPDSLPAFKNEEALLSSLNKLFILSNAEPDGFSSSSSNSSSEELAGLYVIPATFNLEQTDTGIATTLLRNIERSIREFDIEKMTLNWENGLDLNAEARAYYMDESGIVETTKTITAEGTN